MARTGVGYIDIVKAAEAVQTRGEEPTVDRVRAELGTGSKSTIAPLLKRWRTEAGEPGADTGGLPKALVDALKSLYEQMQTQAEQEILRVREECDTTVENLEGELAAAKRTLSERTRVLGEVEQKLQTSTEEGETLQQCLDQTRSALEKSEYQREEGIARIADLKSSIEELKSENRDVREHFEHFQRRTAEDRQQERDQARLAAEQLRQQVASLSEQLTRANRGLEEGKEQLEQQRQQNRELESERQHWMQQSTASRSEIQQLESKQNALQSQLAQNTKELDRVSQQYASLQVSHAAVVREAELQRTTADKLEADLVAARDKLEVLGDENRVILQEKAVLQGQFTQLERSFTAGEPQ